MFNSKNNRDKDDKSKEVALKKPAEEIDLKVRHDRVGGYLKNHMKNFVFDEFSENYLENKNMTDFMVGVPIPLRKEDVEIFLSPAGLPSHHIGENMAWVMGMDPHFKHNPEYIEYLARTMPKKGVQGLVKEAKDVAEKEDYDNACIHFRAALCIDPTNLAAMYGYARVCRVMYLESDDPEYIGNFKAEALEFFELLTELHPRFAEAFYYLGYAYLNLGLYQKAYLAWQDFLKKSMHGKDKREIRERIKQLTVPLEIERGYNAVMAQRWEEGISILEPYEKTQYKDWWPLSYYLGVAYISTGKRDLAVKKLETVLKLNPSHVETMDELADIYEAEENEEMTQKYRKKADLIRSGGYKEGTKTKGKRSYSKDEIKYVAKGNSGKKKKGDKSERNADKKIPQEIQKTKKPIKRISRKPDVQN